ncbi:MAG: hypothetical protein B6D58_03215 [candidate division Zixibacteria bacterium 4484_95]|nr:MAG: hypothetical protein B6D58_03215 [candidate division Zixibacteria bacterium 4484_95]RKX18795.1 MAG: hypothetical protein DRP26_04575 [candidate division Zixibacteria bacterium]
MNNKNKARCERCGKRLKKGGNNYRLECHIVSDFDGYLDASATKKSWQNIAKEIEQSGLTEKELEEQVYFKLEQKLCLDCRSEVINFLKGKS